MKYLRLFIVTGLAWLALAGLSDNIVEWQNWFEIGIMQHWRSVKEWMIAVLFDWVPFKVQPWMIDWMVLGSMMGRTYWPPLAPPYWALLVESKGWQRIRFGCIAATVFIIPIFVFPFAPYAMIITHKVQLLDSFTMRKEFENSHWAKEIVEGQVSVVAACILSIPTLFVCSTLLYELG